MARKKKIKLEFCDDGPPYEKCCFCHNPTAHWAVKTDVACCLHCADMFTEAQLPTKEQWFHREAVMDTLSETNYGYMN